jgi:hypothetical protein
MNGRGFIAVGCSILCLILLLSGAIVWRLLYPGSTSAEKRHAIEAVSNCVGVALPDDQCSVVGSRISDAGQLPAGGADGENLIVLQLDQRLIAQVGDSPPASWFGQWEFGDIPFVDMSLLWEIFGDMQGQLQFSTNIRGRWPDGTVSNFDVLIFQRSSGLLVLYSRDL